MSKAFILQHVPYETAGRILPAFRDYGIPTEVRHLYKGDEVPEDLTEIRVLIALGGPMGVADVGKSQYPFLAKEVELLKRLIAKDRPVLGICLGAQLLAHAAGAKVHAWPPPPAPPPPAEGEKPSGPPAVKWSPEIGWGPVSFPFPGGTEPIVMGQVDGGPMFHWHFDTFDLPKLPAPANAPPPPAPPPPTGSVLLAATKACKNQAFRFRNRLFGFQYHFEMDQAGIEAMLAHGKDDAVKVLGPGAVETIRQDTAKHYPRHARLGDRIIENFVQFLKVY